MRKFYTLLVFCIGFLSFGQIDSVNDSGQTVNGSTGGIVLNNVLINDTLNGNPVTFSTVSLSFISSTNPGLTLNLSTGSVNVAGGTLAGIYTLTYQICENGAPNNCDQANVVVQVNPSAIDAVDDGGFVINSLNGGTVTNILINDSLNGVTVVPSQITLTMVVSTSSGVTLSGTNVIVAPNTPTGTYFLTYQICEVLNPTNCDTANVIINVLNSGLFLSKDGTYVDYNVDGITNVGDTIIYNFKVSNNTSGTLSNVTITDANAIVTGNPITLAAGQNNTTNFTAVHTISQSDIDAGQVDNLATVTATPATGANITATSTDPTPCTICPINITCPYCTQTLIAQTPSIQVILDGIFVDGNGNNFADLGETIMYQIIVINTGNTTLTNVTITSQNSVVVGAPISVLAVGSVNATAFTATHTITQQDFNNEVVDNVVTAIGTPPSGSNVIATSTDPTPNLCSAFNSTCTNCTVVCLPKILNLAIAGNYVDYNNDGFTNVGDIISYQYTLSNLNTTSSIQNLTVVGTNTTIYGNPILSLAPLETNSSTITGTYILTQNDINNGFVTNSATANGMISGVVVLSTFSTTTTLNISNGIKLNAFLDYNSNGVQNVGEPSTNSVGNFTYQINNGTVFTTSSSSGMVTLYESNPLNNYNLGFVLNSGNTTLYTASPSTFSNITVATSSGITTYNFAITSAPISNTAVYLYPNGGGPRPGFYYSNTIFLQNLGNTTIPSGTLTFIVNNVVSITSYPAGATPTANGFTLDYTNLLPNESRYFYVPFQVPNIPTVSIGQLLTNSVSTTIPNGDVNPNNNTATITQDIRGSYDPNDKQESHGGKILHSTFTANDYLNYTIQFENTGNAEAINIQVDDVLDAQLDETSIRMIDASHNYVLDRVNNNLSWRFEGINLPPSNGSATIGHGSITFQIKPKPGYAIGDIIPNFANIYFDFNPAIVTDICNTEFVASLLKDDFAFYKLNIYPNPAQDNLTISNNSVIDSIEILSMLGQTMLTKTVNSLATEISLSELSNGIYFVKIIAENQEKIIKIIKE